MKQCNVTFNTTIKVTKNKTTNKIIILYGYSNIELDIDFTNHSILTLLIEPSIDDIIEAIKQYQNEVAEYYKVNIESLYQFKDAFEKH